ncbi:MAG TPA: hypothetical protein VG167_05760 [Verrucomicrobiae bacterium]|nr:hypothetical protein [Verrucomicrobiae bacterium]
MPFFAEYTELMQKRYQIAVYVSTPAWSRGYNEVSRPAIEAKFGSNVLQEAFMDARKLHNNAEKARGSHPSDPNRKEITPQQTQSAPPGDSFLITRSPADEYDESWLRAALKGNDQANAVVANAPLLTPPNQELTSVDKLAIAGLLAQTKGFFVSPIGSVYKCLQHCTVAIMHGQRDGHAYNIYLVNVRGQPWIKLGEGPVSGSSRF